MMGSWEKLSSQAVHSQSLPQQAATGCPFSLLFHSMNISVQLFHEQSRLLVAQRAVSEDRCWSLQVGQPGQPGEGPQGTSHCWKSHIDFFFFPVAGLASSFFATSVLAESLS